jgi:hypothetical protein
LRAWAIDLGDWPWTNSSKILEPGLWKPQK